GRNALLRGWKIGQAEGMISPKGVRQFESLRHLVEYNDFVRSHITGYGYGIESQPASTLDDHGLAKAQPGAMQAVEHLREGTIDRGRHVVRDVIGEFKDIVIGT